MSAAILDGPAGLRNRSAVKVQSVEEHNDGNISDSNSESSGSDSEYMSTFTPPSFTVKDLLGAIPKHCFERSALRSGAYLAGDIAMLAAFVYAASFIDGSFGKSGSVLNGVLGQVARVAAWLVYVVCAGCVGTGVWIIAHECGHQAFSSSKTINNAVGWVCACAVFCVDEIVVFDDGQAPTLPPERNGYTGYTDPNYFLYHILSYLETPPHLRKALFPMHDDLHLAGILHSLDMPHHMKADEWCPYREAVATGQDVNSAGITGTWVDCGLPNSVFLPVGLDDGTRVTIKLQGTQPESYEDVLEAEAVSPDAPREEAGYYWGYSVRQASSLSAVFTECQHEGGYDVSIGTSERGRPARSILELKGDYYVEPRWNHLLIVFGGVAGLEVAFTADDELRAAGVPEAQELFDRWVNLVPQQGSRTIRTEEAVWIGLTTLRPLMEDRTEVRPSS